MRNAVSNLQVQILSQPTAIAHGKLKRQQTLVQPTRLEKRITSSLTRLVPPKSRSRSISSWNDIHHSW